MERVDYESFLISELLQDYRNGNLNITPWYQRRSVWSISQKSYLINTLFERKPVPSIYIRHVVDLEDERSVKEIVDGQQRIRSILEYRDNRFPARHPDATAPLFYDSLSRTQRERFLSSKLSMGYLIDADDRDVIEIFGRINSVSKTLNPQEKRNAEFSGEFKQFALAKAVDLLPFWRESRLFSDTEISRMLEVQVVSDIIYNMIEGLKDFSAPALNAIYRKYNDSFQEREHIEARWNAVARLIVSQDVERFRNTIFSVYQNFHSLFVYLDACSNNGWTAKIVSNLIYNADNEIAELMLADSLSEIQRNTLSSFTGGNLHRIKARRERETLLRSITPA